MDVTLRPIERRDAAAIAALAAELGYETDEEDVVAAIPIVKREGAAFLAMVDDQPVGWIHVYRTTVLQTRPFAEIAGLVVTEAVRAAGVGAVLVGAAEKWATAGGLDEVRVRSRSTRAEAHRFYERLGYGVEKTSLTFHRRLGLD